MILAVRLYRKEILRFPPAVALGISGFLAIAWKYPEVTFMPEELRLPFAVAQVQFFVALSICMTLFALDVFIGQARALAKAEEILALQAAELDKAMVVQQMAAIIESSEDAIMSVSIDGRLDSWNTAAERIFGYPREEAKDKELASFIAHDHRDAITSKIGAASGGQRAENVETVCSRGDGTLFDGVLNLAPIRDQQGEVTGVSVIARDITESKRAEELRQQALTDDLTGLNNRRGFMVHAEARAEDARSSGKPFTVLFIDLNGLKNINDNLGHQEGDAAISDAADIIRETFRENDIVARLGGDEFCVLLTEDKEDGSESAIGRLKAMTEIHNLQGGKPYKVEMSVGAARYDPTAPCSIDDLIERADSSMYDDKIAGRKRARLLVCDDDPSICSLVEAMFSDAYEVTKTYSGKQVIEHALGARPDLILLDLNLPDMLGIDIVKQLRIDPNTKLIPIIMITGAGDSKSEIESLRAGVDDYVEKPFDEDTLGARMDIVLKRSLRR